MVLETIRMAPERPRTVSKGPGSAPEVSGMSRNGPGMSRKVVEASRRSWKVPEGFGQYHPLPCAPGLGGGSHLGSPGRPGRGRRTKEGESSSKWGCQFLFWQVSGGKVWEALEGLGDQVGLPILFELRPRASLPPI